MTNVWNQATIELVVPLEFPAGMQRVLTDGRWSCHFAEDGPGIS